MRDFQSLPNRRLCGSPYELGGVYPAENSIFKMESDRAIAGCVPRASSAEPRSPLDRYRIIARSFVPLNSVYPQPFSATETHADLSRNFE